MIPIAKTNRTVVRNETYRRGSLNVRERHNERKNENYFNSDVIPDRAPFNIYFKHCAETYEQTFDKLLADNIISTRGLKDDAHIVNEFIFDVNTEYFEVRGGYEYAKKFYEEAYRLAVKEIGDEKYVLSAVMHADEKNKAVSDELGHDVFHYHLHVVYIPIVDKEVYFKKNNKNPELAGKLREVIHQVSHSKKWPREVQFSNDGEIVRSKTGKAVLINSYSLLQDRFFEHMRASGYDGFERGERGSTAQHLSDLEYKTKMESDRAAEISAVVESKIEYVNTLEDSIQEKENIIAQLDKTAEKKISRISALNKKIEDRNSAYAFISEINNIGKNKNLLGQIVVKPEELSYVKDFAREGVSSRVKISELQIKVKNAENERDHWKKQYNILFDKVKLFLDALKHAPKRVMDFLSLILHRPPEKAQPDLNLERKKSIRSHEEVL